MGSPVYDSYLEQFTDYRSITTFWDDYSIAERFGVAAVKDTFKRSFREWKDNYKYLTELVMVLNHKLSQWSYKNPDSLIYKAYEECFYKARDYAVTHLHGNELSYYLRVTD